MKYFQWIASLAMVLVSTATTQAALFDLETKITAADAGAFDRFGFSVAISGNTAIVGAERGGNEVASSGGAYLFDIATGQELFKLTASDGAVSDFFGKSVAISGNRAIVGAFGDDDGGATRGSAYLFDVTSGSELFKLTAGISAGDDNRFGSSVAISGNTAIVGEPIGDGRRSNTGAAYLFDITTGQQLFKLAASDGNLSDQFGSAVAISGNTAIVGSYLNDAGAAYGTGAAYIFDVATGQELFKLTSSDITAGDNFGISVAISGNIAIVGASSKADRYGERFTGAAYAFDASTGAELFKLVDSDTTAGDYFGISVAISGDTAIVGAFGDADAGTQSGSAYLFDATTGSQLAKLTASDADVNDFFGRSVAISGNTALVGAFRDDDAGSYSGAAYLFENVIPEPSTLLLGVMACLGFLQRRNR